MNKKSLKNLALFSLLSFGACQSKKNSASNDSDIARALPDETVIMEYAGGKITAKDVNDQIIPRIKQSNAQLLEAYQQSAEQALLMKLVDAEVKKQGVASPEALLERVTATIAVSDEQIKNFIKENKLEKGYPDPKTGKLRKVSNEEIKAFLSQQQMVERRQAYLQELLSNAKSRLVLAEPATKIIDNKDSAFKGGANAKVVIYVFSDFQCPFCSKGKTLVDQIHAAYGDKVKIAFRHLPIESKHPEAKPAALASICLNKEGKFWPFHDKLFDNQAEISQINIEKWAAELGWDKAKLSACVAEPATNAIFDLDVKTAQEASVDSTPTFYVNGKKVAGALPFPRFKSIIDAELSKN